MNLNKAINILKTAQRSHTITLMCNNIDPRGAKYLAEQLKISKYSHTINLRFNCIGSQGAQYLAEQLKNSQHSHTIILECNGIDARGAKYLAEQLKYSKHSHTINLGYNDIGSEGANYLKKMIESSKFPPYIILETDHLHQTIESNDAILSIKDSSLFKLKIKKKFLCSMPVLKGIFYKDIQVIIADYLEIQEVNYINLQTLQNTRMQEMGVYTWYNVAPGTANYDVDLSALDISAAVMLLTEHTVSLMPQEVRMKASEYVNIKYPQYIIEATCAAIASYQLYGLKLDYSLPLIKATSFYLKEAMAYILSTNIKNARESISEYSNEYLGEKEQILIEEILLGIGMGVLTPIPTLTIVVNTAGAVAHYLDMEDHMSGKIIGGILGLVGSYAGGGQTYYQYALHMIGGAYVGDMISKTAIYAYNYVTTEDLQKCTQENELTGICEDLGYQTHLYQNSA